MSVNPPNPISENDSFFESVKLSKVIIPVLLGLGVVGWLLSRQLDLDALNNVNWTYSTLTWILLAVLMYVLRHMFYAWRLMIMTGHEFGFWKSMELIVIWEFASAVSPTSVGGSGVALILLAQERISGAKTVAVVLYSLVLDTLFFVLSLPLLYFILGAIIIRPGMESLLDMDGYGYTFLGVLLAMIIYGGVFFYGLFINPHSTKRFLLLISRIPFLKRFKRDLRTTAMDVVVSAAELKKASWKFHGAAFGATAGAWITRFLAINFIIMALVSGINAGLLDHAIMFSRGATMHVITAFSPTPGGSGIAELLFGGFYSDYIPKSISTLIALVWRLITYYPYLLLGAIIIPNWIRKIMSRGRGF